jgi:hypothetical protein
MGATSALISPYATPSAAPCGEFSPSFFSSLLGNRGKCCPSTNAVQALTIVIVFQSLGARVTIKKSLKLSKLVPDVGYIAHRRPSIGVPLGMTVIVDEWVRFFKETE